MLPVWEKLYKDAIASTASKYHKVNEESREHSISPEKYNIYFHGCEIQLFLYFHDCEIQLFLLICIIFNIFLYFITLYIII